MNDFKNIDYLKQGNSRQKKAFQVLSELQIFYDLSAYHPLLTGTIPIGIDLPESDLDIICYCNNHKNFSELVSELYNKHDGYTIKNYIRNNIETTVVKFKKDSFIIEIFAQNIPTEKQNAYRHMLIEDKILKIKGHKFKSKIIQLKSEGYKTEPAFAKLLDLKGNPYDELLKFDIFM